MSRHNAWRATLLLAAFVIPGSGCWEQWSESWWPQMKWQQAVQAFEAVNHEGRVEGFLPPEGAVPIQGDEPEIGRMDIAAADALVNPQDPNDYRSLKNGEELYDIYCTVCHGATGMGDGPVSAAGTKTGPFAGVYPLVGLVTARSDGYLYNVIRIGSGGFPGLRMPGYRRIPAEGRWDIVNYIRFLDSKKGQL